MVLLAITLLLKKILVKVGVMITSKLTADSLLIKVTEIPFRMVYEGLIRNSIIYTSFVKYFKWYYHTTRVPGVLGTIWYRTKIFCKECVVFIAGT